eukprot:6816773-Prymnesium_polylepis.1
MSGCVGVAHTRPLFPSENRAERALFRPKGLFSSLRKCRLIFASPHEPMHERDGSIGSETTTHRESPRLRSPHQLSAAAVGKVAAAFALQSVASTQVEEQSKAQNTRPPSPPRRPCAPLLARQRTAGRGAR